MAFALRVKDNNGYTVVEHVAIWADDQIIIPDYDEVGLSQYSYRKSHHLIQEVQEKHPDWEVETKEFDINILFDQ